MAEFKRAAWQVVRSALVYLTFCLIAMAIFAAIVRAASPSDTTITVVSWVLKVVGCFLACLLLKGPRVVYKGLATGTLGALLTLFTFAAIGGGFHTSVFFLLELVACALFGALGGLLGAKLHKEA